LIVVALCLLAAACSGGGSSSEDDAGAADSTSTTASAPANTTSTLPRLPGTADSGEVRAVLTTTGVVAPVLGEAAGGRFRVGTPCGEETVVSQATPLYGATIVLDPGHGGVEPGAAGSNGLVEKDLNLAVAKLAADVLRDQGATVVLTRTDDYRVTLQARADIGKALDPRAFVSIHHNGGADGPMDKPGTETYYQRGSADSKRLAGLIYEEVLAAFAGRPDVTWFGNVDAGAKWRSNDSGGDYYGILRITAGVPAVLSEALFLSASDSEAALLADPAIQQAEAEAIARAVSRYVLTDDPGSGFVVPIPRTSPAGGGGGASGCIDPPMS
jgi:N-acetylmuramoyl-L-alanine amidase